VEIQQGRWEGKLFIVSEKYSNGGWDSPVSLWTSGTPARKAERAAG